MSIFSTIEACTCTYTVSHKCIILRSKQCALRLRRLVVCGITDYDYLLPLGVIKVSM